MWIEKRAKKSYQKNNKTYKKFSDHIGTLPIVIVSPSDRDLIVEGSDTRRKFIDSILSQTDTKYLKNLIEHNKILAQRNSLLKFFHINKTFDANTLEAYNNQIVPYVNYIHKKRGEFIEKLSPIFTNTYKIISQGKEKVDIIYQSHLNTGEIKVLQKDSFQIDLDAQYTTKGVHKDDFIFEIDEFSIKKNSSQGQQKSFLIALKLAKFEIIKSLRGFAPILLLDDIFDKLDKHRVEQIIKLVGQKHFNQIFISDTHHDRMSEIMEKIGNHYKIFEL